LAGFSRPPPPTLSLAQSEQELPEFYPQTVLRDWDNGQAFRLLDVLTGACVSDATDSGKAPGPAKHLAADFGGV
jgi:hypothetical protein